MPYRIINNLTKDNNHYSIISNLFRESSSIVVASPYLMGDFTHFLSQIDCLEEKEIHLITTLSPGSLDQFRNIDALHSLIHFAPIRDHQENFRISINNKLHGKVYIFKSGDVYTSAIISSANFTNNGLSGNHEWGVRIFGENEIIALEKDLLSAIVSRHISFETVEEMIAAKKAYLERQSPIEIPKVDLNLADLIPASNVTLTLDQNVNYWIKPIGVSDDIISIEEVFGDLPYNLHFARSPIGVRKNDILIAYAVGHQKILSVYRATHERHNVGSEDADWGRWPHYIVGENLTPGFGSSWNIKSLNPFELGRKFMNLYPNAFLTRKGATQLKGLNYGHDKMGLTFEFAEYIINAVYTLNN